MSPEETADAEAMKAKCNDLRMSAFSAMNNLTRLDEAGLKARGYKTIPEAVFGTFKYYEGLIAKEQAMFLKKWPD